MDFWLVQIELQYLDIMPAKGMCLPLPLLMDIDLREYALDFSYLIESPLPLDPAFSHAYHLSLAPAPPYSASYPCLVSQIFT